jgi:hypothetical protein
MHKFNRFITEDLQLTLEYHDTLNPLIWDENDKMKSNIRDRLLYIGKLWADFANIPAKSVKDIVLTGGNANYNYTPYSDLDIHLLVKLDDMPVDKNFLSDYLYDKKVLWSLKHASLSVMGYPVELYAEDYRRQVASHQGVYSLKKAKWIYKPNLENHPAFESDTALKSKIEDYIGMIEKVLSEPGDHVAEIKKLKEKLHAMRSAGIQRSGEFSNENLIYKELRNRGHVDALGKYLQKAQDAQLSLY